MVSHDGAWREEIEVELKDLNEESFNGTIVVYFDQRLGAAHTKCWLKSSFSAKKLKKS